MENQTLVDIFRLSPAIAALLAVIVLLYRLLIKKEETLQKIIEISKEDVKRQARIVTLLEILVNRAAKE